MIMPEVTRETESVMLQLKDIVKEYQVGEGTVSALKGVNLDLRDSEFVAVLGPSGCGKTTLLNIVGGLDSYSSGDLVINGTSTKDYRDADWDTYRNHRVGFVFQSYNLIPHQDALANVELSLQISGISKAERRERARQALEKVGLADQLHKKPNMMSGGQMQRVAIARALVNDPDIILADEPTGALDSETSLQVMDILKQVAADRLVIMVTHNPELADTYATRIVRLKDGLVISDSDPLTSAELASPQAEAQPKRTKLGFGTAMSLSLNNLLTKKGRTILTSFAGAIGIIGIALILALSNGMNDYISGVESDTMGSYPIELEKVTYDIGGMMNGGGAAAGGGMFGALSGSGTEEGAEEASTEGIYSNNVVADSVTTSASMTSINDLGKFKTYLEEQVSTASASLAAVEYGYDVVPQVFRLTAAEADSSTDASADASESVLLVSPSSLDSNSSQSRSGMSAVTSSMSALTGGGLTSGSTSSAWAQLVNDQTLRESHYELLEGSWPTTANEVALVVSSTNEISDYVLYTLGLMDINEMDAMVNAIANDESYDDSEQSFSYSDAIGLEYKVFAPAELYFKSESDGVWINKSTDQDFLSETFAEGGTTVTITCVLRAGDGAEITGGVAYDGELTQQLMSITASSEIVKEQLDNPATNMLTGKLFEEDDAASAATDDATNTDSADADTDAATDSSASPSGFDASMYGAGGYDASSAGGEATMSLSEDQIAVLVAQMSDTTPQTYDAVIEALGYITPDQPTSIALYPVDFEGKAAIESFITDYNNQVENDSDRVAYTDMIGILTSSITSIVDTISLILIAFVAISLIVSSIMIAIITYISVLERTKEIGVLRAIGASKGDISKIFNAETFIEGLISGVSAIVITLLICIPINAVVSSLVGVDNIASLPLEYSLILIAISVVLTLLAGFIPSRMAAKKDPVVALRTE